MFAFITDTGPRQTQNHRFTFYKASLALPLSLSLSLPFTPSLSFFFVCFLGLRCSHFCLLFSLFPHLPLPLSLSHTHKPAVLCPDTQTHRHTHTHTHTHTHGS